MELSIGMRVRRAWNVFRNKDPVLDRDDSFEGGCSYRPSRFRFTSGKNRSIITSICNRMALDVAAITIQHVQLDKNDRFLSVMKSNLNECFLTKPNVDQTPKALIQDIVMSMFDEGVVAIVPTDCDYDFENEQVLDVFTLRTGEILDWYPQKVKIRVYNENTGRKEDVILPKSMVVIVENPFYAVMNEPNSTMQRLLRKLVLLDVIDEQSGSGKLDLIIGLPYVIKTEARRRQVEKRRADIENQLRNSKYGIAYTDGTEHITQLNRPIENNLMKQIEYLTNMLYSQLGITQSVMDSSADEKTMLNYYERTIDPVVSAIVDGMRKSFITELRRSQHESIMYFRNPFKLVTISDFATVADTLTRNEIATSNEMRQVIGWKPSDNPRADELVNKNLKGPENKGVDVDTDTSNKFVNEEDKNEEGKSK